ncbi:MAG: hypothetical protein ABL895_03645 [Cyclobacteriaceae bacterium]
MNKKSFPTDNVDDDIDLYLRLLTYGQSFTFKSKWYDRLDLYLPRQDEDTFVARCRDKMIEEGLIKVKEERKQHIDGDLFVVTLKGDEIQKTGWKKYLEQTSKRRFDWDNLAKWTNRVLTAGLTIVTVYYYIFKDGQTTSELNTLKEQLQQSNKVSEKTFQSLTDSLTSLKVHIQKLESSLGQK